MKLKIKFRSPAIHSAILLLVPSLFNLRRFDSASGTPFLETPRNVKCRAPFPLVVHSLGYNAKEAVVVAGALAFAWLAIELALKPFLTKARASIDKSDPARDPDDDALPKTTADDVPEASADDVPVAADTKTTDDA